MLKYFMFVSLVILHSNARDNGMYYVVDNGISSPYTSTPNYELGGRRYMNSFQKLQPVFDEKVTLQLYYECLCPDCREFDTHDFQDTVHKLGPYLNIYLYPFGNAQFVEHEGHYEFTCQHGPKECYGNKLHACAIDHLKNMTLAVFYNSCMMDYSQLGNGSDDRAADLDITNPTEGRSTIIGQTTETVTFAIPVNQPPTLNHHMKKFGVPAGKAFRYIIPANLFTDPEEGTNLTFTMYHADNVKLSKDSWIQFIPSGREVYGLAQATEVQT